MKGKERGGGVADEESNGGVADEESSSKNAIEALHESVMVFVSVHRSDVRSDGRVDRCAIERCMKGKERCGGVAEEGNHSGGGVAEDDDDESGDEIDRDDDGDGGGDSAGDDDDENGREGGPPPAEPTRPVGPEKGRDGVEGEGEEHEIEVPVFEAGGVLAVEVEVEELLGEDGGEDEAGKRTGEWDWEEGDEGVEEEEGSDGGDLELEGQAGWVVGLEGISKRDQSVDDEGEGDDGGGDGEDS
ncbi:hypothetical protein Scep_012217 [Stephania cephalantha]|uniref:Uncharacterized protein n=1 Tax=Stephania cephalantha TaxID=152367 RepID=A0AAP0JEP8_9MAGN